MSLAPVALFVFKRPDLTRLVFEQIRKARPGRLLLIADGPRADHPGEAELCEQTRAIVANPDWPCEVLTNFSSENLGCGRRMISGINWVFENCEEAMILEDDCLPGQSFFSFCTEMLNRYREDDRVVHVSGDNFQDGIQRGTGAYFFCDYPLTWGWAAWRRSWKLYDPKMSDWPEAREKGWLRSVFDDPKEVKYWDMIFDRMHRGLIDTWDYPWLYCCWRNQKLSIQPNRNLISNVGVGVDSTHFKQASSTIGIPIRDLDHFMAPDSVRKDSAADRYAFAQHILERPDDGWLTKTFRRIVNPRGVARRLFASVQGDAE